MQIAAVRAAKRRFFSGAFPIRYNSPRVHGRDRPVFSASLRTQEADDMKICTLASGSSGNSLYLESQRSKILIDAGVSLRRISRSLQSLGTSVEEIDAVVLSHEHGDHSRAVAKMETPVYVCGSAAEVLRDRVADLREFDSETPFRVKDLLVTPFSVSHDARDPVGFTVSDGRSRIGAVTDIGRVTRLVVESLRNCDALVIESNHDREMLLEGPYPWDLKQRIGGGDGHLSNEESAELLGAVLHEGLRHVVLAHLSRSNNTPERALAASREILRERGAEHIALRVAPRNEISEVLTV